MLTAQRKLQIDTLLEAVEEKGDISPAQEEDVKRVAGLMIKGGVRLGQHMKASEPLIVPTERGGEKLPELSEDTINSIKQVAALLGTEAKVLDPVSRKTKPL